ncbi:AzlD domain-containing protein [Saccharopolyspora hirsuta]|uniref:AzlD domain-containing protein n=1 Tax=Saccharopolyspora hirsuta TaxID=1837 RepID=A0A5M7BRQ6_SACHI|nr:AzlD domain-containing protein [Saccharopolyspora hirsuta]KAA5831820.1 AzlD domain-containing protein [Saccharopolyspora hirsuta]
MTLGVVFALAAGTYAMRLAGPLLRGRLQISPQWEQLMSIAAIVLLGAFVATSAVFESGGFAGWARFAGVAVGGVLAWRRAPFVLVVVAAAATTALLRLFELAV